MKYQQVIDYIEQQIETGKIKGGHKLPSIRELANLFSCNKDTVIRAYKELELHHRVYALPKSGYYLVESGKAVADKNETIDFKTTLPDSRLLPYNEFNHSINKAIENYKQELFSYGQVEGLASLREVLARLFWEQQVFADQDDILITSGAQQALSLLVKIPFPNGQKKILVEQPSYSVLQRLLELYGFDLVGIERTAQGIDLKELESLFATQQFKFFYTIPRFHNPLGTSYSESDKKRIVELASKYQVYLVEDDYLGDLATHNNLALHHYDTDNRVIYVKSFSKSFMPGIRIGAAVLPEILQQNFKQYKRYDDLTTSVLAQGGLEVFIKSGMYKNHLKKVKYQYQNKMRFVKTCLKAAGLKNVDYSAGNSGFFIWIKLPETINAKTLALRLAQKNIEIMTSDHFYIKMCSPVNGFRLCISALSKQQIQEGVFGIAEEIKAISLTNRISML